MLAVHTTSLACLALPAPPGVANIYCDKWLQVQLKTQATYFINEVRSCVHLLMQLLLTKTCVILTGSSSTQSLSTAVRRR